MFKLFFVLAFSIIFSFSPNLVGQSLVRQVEMTNETAKQIQQVQLLLLQDTFGDLSTINKSTFPNLVVVNGIKHLLYSAKLNQDFDVNLLKNKGLTIGTISSNWASLYVPITHLNQVFQLQGVLYLEISPILDKHLDDLIGDVRADSVHAGIGLEHTYRGKDVIIGVIDWGFDFTHPMFFDSVTNESRVIACWDHWKLSGPAPKGFAYGTVYDGKEALALAQSDTANNRGYDTHGTHVAGIAGGWTPIGIKGVAPECSFLFVQVDWQVGTFLDAVDWMYKVARREQKRLVINMSFGSYHRATLDSTSFFHDVIKDYAKKGVVMVTSAGNNGNNSMHIQHDFSGDTIQSQVSMLSKGTTFPRFNGHKVIMWGEKNNVFDVGFSIYAPNNQLLLQGPMISSNELDTISNSRASSYLVFGSDTLFYEIEGEAKHPLNDKPTMSIIFRKTNDNWKVGLRSTAQTGSVHYWNLIQNTIGTSNTGQPFIRMLPTWLPGDNWFTVSDPAVVPDVITVASHNPQITSSSGEVFAGAISPFSSRGPTMDNLIKPDISAPGSNILSAVSSFTTQQFTSDRTFEFEGKTFDFARFSGTSMSGPAVAGVAALLLEANPTLSPAQIKQILMVTAREDIRTDQIPSNTWGMGKIDAYKALLLAFNTPGDPSFNSTKGVVFPNPSNGYLNYRSETGQSVDIQIIDLNGKRVFEKKNVLNESLNLSTLKKGVYIVKVFDNNVWYHFKWIRSDA